MAVRKNLMPYNPGELVCSIIVGLFVPLAFIVDVFTILPVFHEPGSFLHAFTLIFASFLVYNIMVNYLACLMIDTSFEANYTKPKSATANAEETAVPSDWRYCEDCKLHAPPRSWHCKSCRTCILKRDHHCVFTGCCIGHYNHRYFLLFVAYLCFGAIYAFVYNSIYVWVLHGDAFAHRWTLLKLVCPALMFFMGSPWDNFFLCIYALNVLAIVYGVVLVYYNYPIVLHGGVAFERDKRTYSYDMGVRENIRNIFGERVHLAWLSPLVKSKLPLDGVHWEKVKDKNG